jgi:predicted Ser/Thr protein kinase
VIGRTLDRYRIESKLGEGGMGVVYKARDTHLDRVVAIKVLPGDRVSDPERKQRFVQEAKAASALNHPNIVTVHDIRSDSGVDFIVMEFAEGRTLDQIIPAKGLGIAQALRIGAQIADALATAHEAGIVHRDLKPSNVSVTDQDRVKVLDFGLAKLVDPAEAAAESRTRTSPLTQMGMAVGTAAYMSPEQPLWRLPLHGGAPGRVVEGVNATGFEVIDKGVYYLERVAGETKLRYFDFATRQSTLVAGNLGTVTFGLTASRDGRTILYSRIDSSVNDLMLVDNFR